MEIQSSLQASQPTQAILVFTCNNSEFGDMTYDEKRDIVREELGRVFPHLPVAVMPPGVSLKFVDSVSGEDATQERCKAALGSPEDDELDDLEDDDYDDEDDYEKGRVPHAG